MTNFTLAVSRFLDEVHFAVAATLDADGSDTRCRWPAASDSRLVYA